MKILYKLSLIFGLMSAANAQTTPKNILVIMTDDQRWDTVSQMPNLSEIAAQGVQFTNAIQPTPLCGPSRSMLYSGGYHSQDTGVLSNEPPNGGVTKFHDESNLGVMLQGVGYDTTFIGKWINGYESLPSTLGQYYVPPGWSSWIGRRSVATGTSWFAFKYILGSSTNVPNSSGALTTTSAYTTYWERDQVIAKLNAAATNPAKPFFILWAPSAPHPPAIPAPEDANAFSDYLYRDRGVGETDLSDKPAWVQNTKPLGEGPGYGDGFIRNQLRALQGVDRSVKAIVDQLKTNGQYDNTVIIYTSDNGYMWNEHNQWFKSKPYQEDLRVPFIALVPGISSRTDSSLIAPSLDIGPTLFELAGINKTTAGMSILPLLNDPATPWRNNIFLEENDILPNNGSSEYAGAITTQYKYVTYWTGEEELYDWIADPFELNSIHRDPDQASLKASLLASTTAQLGLAIIPSNPMAGKVRKLYTYQLKVRGGFAPFNWTMASGALPHGITLNPLLGKISGVPTTAGKFNFAVKVTDSSMSPQTNLPHAFTSKVMTVAINR